MPASSRASRKYGNITLKTGITAGPNDLDLFKWHNDVSAGQVKDKRKKVVIHRPGPESGDESAGARFVITDAWPIKYTRATSAARATR